MLVALAGTPFLCLCLHHGGLCNNKARQTATESNWALRFMVKIEVNGWDENKKWASWPKDNLVRRLVEAGMLRRDAKRLTDEVFEKKCVIISISEGKHWEGIRHVLESMGAAVKVERTA
jgi:hypothetical protein